MPVCKDLYIVGLKDLCWFVMYDFPHVNIFINLVNCYTGRYSIVNRPFKSIQTS